MLSLVKLLRDYFERAGMPHSYVRYIFIHMAASAYSFGYAAPSPECPMAGASVLIRKMSFRMSQRIVAKKRFYGSASPRMDSVMIESDERSNLFPQEPSFPVWFARVLAFVRICDKRNSEQRQKEMCFIQFYEVL